MSAVPRAVSMVVLAVSVVLAATGCDAAARPTTAAPATDAGAGRLVMVIRHGEKPAGSSRGVDVRGNPDTGSLTATGWNRAHRLVDLLAPADGHLRAGLARPRKIYAAGATSSGDGTRTRETVTPLAEKLGVPLDTSFGKGEEAALVEQVVTQPGPTLIAWQHGEIPAIANAFPSVTPSPPSQWPNDRFDVIWTFTQAADGWHFAQLPELVLPQDRAAVIGSGG